MNAPTVREKTLASGRLPAWGRVFPAGGFFSRRLAASPLLALALLPMVVLLAIVVIFVWVSLQTGLVGTAEAKYSLANYGALFGNPFVLKVLENTLIFAVVMTFVALVVGLPVAWITERTMCG